MAQKGFTFIELMVTLALTAVPVMRLVVQRERERELHAALMEMRAGLDAYKRASDQGRIEVRVGESGYPKSLDELVAGIEDVRSPTHAKIYFLRRLPRDPFNADSTLDAARTWGKRSYESEPDDPREGADVFDVFSLSEEKGLNGIPYREW
jgi:general secretion pathway protein G